MRILIHFDPGPSKDAFLGARLRKNIKGALELQNIVWVDSIYAKADICHLLSPLDEALAKEAKEEGIPIRAWNPLQKGETIEIDGVTYSPDMVMGAPRKGIKLTYCTDSRPMERIHEHAKDADLFICEGMYAEKEKIVKAKQYKHMTFYEAADMAKRAGVKELWLTHFSPSLVRAEDYMPQVRDIFANAYLGKDGKSVELMFDED